MSKQKRKPRADSKPADQPQQADRPLVIATYAPHLSFAVIGGGSDKHHDWRTWGKIEFVQAVLFLKVFNGLPPSHISGREKKVVVDVNKHLASDPQYVLGPVSGETVARAVTALRKANS